MIFQPTIINISTSYAIFITDIEPYLPDGNVFNKVTSSDGSVLESCATSTQDVIVKVLAVTGISNFKPNVTVNGEFVELSGNINDPNAVYTGSIRINLNNQPVVTAVHEDGSEFSTNIQYVEPPTITLAKFTGDYPTNQIELKQGDIFDIEASTDVEFNEIHVLDYGAFEGQVFYFDSTFTKTVSCVIADRGNYTNFYGAKIRIRDLNGTLSDIYTISGILDGVNGVFLNNTHPEINLLDIAYPIGQLGIKDNESAIVTYNMNNYDSVEYVTNEISIIDVSNNQIEVIRTGGTYNVDTPNLTIIAHKNDNRSTTELNIIVNIADEEPIITIGGVENRLRSGGNDGSQIQKYQMTLNSNQIILGTPSMLATGGYFDFADWVMIDSSSFYNILSVHDSIFRGFYEFNNINIKNIAGKNAKIILNTIYEIGGFVSRTVNLPLGEQVAIINVAVSDYSKLPNELNWSWNTLIKSENVGEPLGVYTPDKYSINMILSPSNTTEIRILDIESINSYTGDDGTTITIEEYI